MSKCPHEVPKACNYHATIMTAKAKSETKLTMPHPIISSFSRWPKAMNSIASRL